MRVLVLGGDGMLGHQLLQGLTAAYDVRATVRGMSGWVQRPDPSDACQVYTEVDVRDSERLRHILDDFRPAAVVNAVGIVKQRPAAKEFIPSIEVNALFPHRLSDMAAEIGARVIQISTDCVFSGRAGGYTEAALPDPVDLYGSTKLLGELVETHCLTLRTSIIGLELGGQQGLVEWALRQTGEVRGYRRAVYSGLTTIELTRVIDLVLADHENLSGVWHVASEPISKFHLLTGLFAKLGRSDARVSPDDTFVCDRSLRAEAFARKTGYIPPTWDAMLDELVGLILERETALNDA